MLNLYMCQMAPGLFHILKLLVHGRFIRWGGFLRIFTPHPFSANNFAK